jgi:hypothetical protein
MGCAAFDYNAEKMTTPATGERPQPAQPLRKNREALIVATDRVMMTP